MSSTSCKNATVLQDGKNAKCAPVLSVFPALNAHACLNTTILTEES